MFRFSTILLFFIIIGLIGGSIFLSTWEIPAPTVGVEKVIPDDQISN